MNYSNSAKHPQQPSLDTLRSKGPLRKTFLDPELQPYIYIYMCIRRYKCMPWNRLPYPSSTRRPSKGEPPFEITGSRSCYGDSLYLSISSPLPHSLFRGFDLLVVSARFLEKDFLRVEEEDGNGRCVYCPGFRYLLTVSNMSLVPYRNRYTPCCTIAQILIVLIACALRGEDKRRILCCYDIERNLANAIS